MLRTAIIRGPAIVQFDGSNLYSKDDITCTIDEESFQILTSVYGPVDERIKERRAEITFTPVGEWETSAIDVLWTPYATMAIGAGIFGTPDKPLVIWTRAGKKITFGAAAVTKMPDIIASATKTLIGSVTFMCIGKEDTYWDDGSVSDGSFMKIEAAAFPDAVEIDPLLIVTSPFAAGWGILGAPWDNIDTIDGWTITFNPSLSPFEADTPGIIDYTLASLDVSAKCKPVGVTEQDIITAMGIQGPGAHRGRSLSAIANGNDLVLNGEGVGLTVYRAAIKRAPLMFGSVANRAGEIEWVATRQLTAGALNPLFSVST